MANLSSEPSDSNVSWETSLTERAAGKRKRRFGLITEVRKKARGLLFESFWARLIFRTHNLARGAIFDTCNITFGLDRVSSN